MQVAAATPFSRRLIPADSFRWPKIVIGLLLALLAGAAVWFTTWNSLECVDAACVLTQEHPLRPNVSFPFDARNPPAVAVESATVGKSGKGKKLVLRYADGAEVELLRDWGDGVEAKATELRNYFVRRAGRFSVHQEHDTIFLFVSLFAGITSFLMFLDGANILGWRRVRVDPGRTLLTLDNVLLGIRIKQRVFPISAVTTVGSMPHESGNPHFAWLTLEEPGAKAQKLPLLDRPGNRAVVEAALDPSSPQPASAYR